MNCPIKSANLMLAVALLLAPPRTQQRQAPDQELLWFGKQAFNDPAATLQTTWREVRDVDLNLERTCKQKLDLREQSIDWESDKDYLRVECPLKVESRREPKGRPEVNGWKCELLKQERKVKITYWCDKHNECDPGGSQEEPKSYLKVKITIKVEIKE